MKRIVLALLFTVVTVPAFAQDPANNHEKKGFWFSLGGGVGSLGCSDCGSRETGFSGGLSLGGTINEKLLIGVGTTGWAKSVEGETLSLGTFDFRVRFYPVKNNGFHINGGVGLASVSFAGESESGVGVLVGVGYDVRMGKNRKWSLTPYWNGIGMSFDGGDANFGQIGLAFTIH